MMQRMFTPVCDTCGDYYDEGFHYSAVAKAASISDGWVWTGSKCKCVNCIKLNLS